MLLCLIIIEIDVKMIRHFHQKVSLFFVGTSQRRKFYDKNTLKAQGFYRR